MDINKQQRQFASIYDEWVRNLPPEEQRWCARAIRNLTVEIRNLGPLSARELIVAMLLYMDDH
jgi:hypothetical protein